MDILSYILSMAYTKKSLIGMGALKGAPCKINSIVDNPNGTHDITFAWKDDNDVTHTSVLTVANGETPTIQKTNLPDGGYRISFTTTNPAQSVSVDVKDGISVTNAEIDDNTQHLIITLSDGNTIDCGEVKGAQVLSELEDMNLTNLRNGDILRYDSETGKWCNYALQIIVNLEDLSNVDINNLQEGQVLVYDATDRSWKNQDAEIADISKIKSVHITNLGADQILKYNGTNWVNADNKIVELKDVNITDPQNGQILVYDAVNQIWKNGSPSSTSTSLDDLSNVNIDSITLQSGQTLVYDAENDVWTNGDVASSLDGLSDVNIDDATLTNGQTLVYDEENDKWVNGEGGKTYTAGSGIIISDTDEISSTIFTGTLEQWNALTPAQQGMYEILNIKITNEVVNLANLIPMSEAMPFPTPSYNGTCRLYIGATNQTYVKGTIYQCQETDPNVYAWKPISTAEVPIATTAIAGIVKPDGTSISVEQDGTISVIEKAFVGTEAEWNLLTPQEQNQYDIINIYNDEDDLNLGIFLKKLTTMDAASNHPSELVVYIGATTEDYTRGYFYRSTPHVISGEVQYTWERVDVQPAYDDYEGLLHLPRINGVQLLGNKTSSDLDVQRTLQYITMPEANSDNIGRVVQYIGITSIDFASGYWYKCQYNNISAQYEWVQVDVSGDTALANRVTVLENNQGDMSQLTVTGVTSLVEAINQLDLHSVRTIVYDPLTKKLVITYKDNTTFEFDVSSILSQTNLGELHNVLDTSIQNGNLLQYDSAISKYKPYDISTILGNLLQQAKDYTDQEIATISQASALVVDAKPTYDSSTGVVVYYQSGVMHTTMAADTRFYYTDSVSGDSFCTSWIDGVEFTFSVASVDYDDFVSKTTDVVSTYNTTMLDKTKIPDIAALDALYGLLSDAIALKVNTADIVDGLSSSSTTVPLSANQGRVLKGQIDEKQDIIQFLTMPNASSDTLNDIVQYIGATDLSFTNGRFYKCVSDGEATPTYSWTEVKFSADYDATIIDGSTNAPQGNAVYDALALKQDVDLSVPISVEDTPATTVEGAINALNSNKAKVFQYTTMPIPVAGLEGNIVQYVGVESLNYVVGAFYQCKEIEDSDPTAYEWSEVSANIVVDNVLSNTSPNLLPNSVITNAIQALQAGVVIFYASESVLPSVVDYAGDEIVAVGTIAYCVQEMSWKKVTAINSTSLAITWSSYDPHIITGNISADDVNYDGTDSGLVATNVQDAIDEIKGGLGTVSSKDFTTYLTPNSTDIPEARAVYNAITSAVSSVYQPYGDLTVAQLVPSLLVQANVGHIYNITDSGVTTEYFVQGAGVPIAVGDNVGIVYSDNGFLFNLMAGITDLRDYQKKLLDTPLTIDGVQKTTVEGALGGLTTGVNGSLKEVNALPTASVDNLDKTYLLIGTQTGYDKGAIYQCQSDGELSPTYSWVKISSADVPIATTSVAGLVKPDGDTINVDANGAINVDDGYKTMFVGTTEQWNNLNISEKAKFDTYCLTDDITSGQMIVSDAVTDGDLNPVTSNAVYANKMFYKKLYTGTKTVSAGGYASGNIAHEINTSKFDIIGGTISVSANNDATQVYGNVHAWSSNGNTYYTLHSAIAQNVSGEITLLYVVK